MCELNPLLKHDQEGWFGIFHPCFRRFHPVQSAVHLKLVVVERRSSLEWQQMAKTPDNRRAAKQKQKHKTTNESIN